MNRFVIYLFDKEDKIMGSSVWKLGEDSIVTVERSGSPCRFEIHDRGQVISEGPIRLDHLVLVKGDQINMNMETSFVPVQPPSPKSPWRSLYDE